MDASLYGRLCASLCASVCVPPLPDASMCVEIILPPRLIMQLLTDMRACTWHPHGFAQGPAMSAFARALAVQSGVRRSD